MATNLLAARIQMAVSLGFHIVFAAIGIAMPFLMATSYAIALKKRDAQTLKLTKAWSKGVAIFFATGAVSGTVLSFELGTLWPEFMKHAGPIIGMPFSWEGTAFFLEAIAIGVFLYGWKRISPIAHWTSALVVGVSGVFSGLFVICANGWMNSPSGFDWVKGKALNIDPWAAMFNKAALNEGIHMTIAAFEATGFAVAGVHAYLALKKKRKTRLYQLHLKALRIALVMGAIAALVQPLSGDRSAKDIAIRQPEKLAAMESHYTTMKGAPLNAGPFHIPKLLSFLAHGDFNAEVIGLDRFEPRNRPPVTITHLAFQIMVGLGTLLALFSGLSLFALWRKPKWIEHKTFLKACVVATPLGFIALEAGWVVTEVGRQPWIIYKVMRTSEAVTPMPGLWVSCVVFTLLYLVLTFVVTWLMHRQFKALELEETWQ
jgi:cytochrome d ubiquinol oxidase subunit I